MHSRQRAAHNPALSQDSARPLPFPDPYVEDALRRELVHRELWADVTLTMVQHLVLGYEREVR